MSTFVSSKLHSRFKHLCSSMSIQELESFIEKTKDIKYNYDEFIKYVNKFDKLPSQFWIDDHLFSPEIIIDYKNIDKLLKESKNVLITAGAGFSVDSGIPTFEDGNNHDITLFKDKNPHDGYYKLLNYVKDKNYFVFTSNIDGFFRTVGFKNVYECHGSLDSTVCIGNTKWDSQIHKDQEVSFEKWIKETKHILIIELGCGVTVPTIKEYNSILCERKDVKMIVVNIKHYNTGENIYPFNKSIKEFTNLL